MDIKTLRVDAWKALNEARAKVDAAKDGELSAEDQAFIDRAIADGEELMKAADREARMSKVMEVLGLENQRPTLATERPSRKALVATDAYTKDFGHYLRTGEVKETLHQVKALQEGTDSEGGYIVPPEFLARLVDSLAAAAPMLGLATVIDVNTNAVEIPTVASHGSAAWTAEEVAFNDSDAAFGTKSITVYKATRLSKVSEELLADAYFDLDSWMAGEFGRSLGVLLNTALTVGTGSAQPYGIVTAAAAGMTVTQATGGATGIGTVDHLHDVKFKVPAQYRTSACRWMFADSTLKIIALIRQTVVSGETWNQYLWQPGLTGADPGTLLGYPIVINPDVAAMAASAKSLVFGDFSPYWVIRRPAISMQRLNELYSASGQVGFRIFVRYGADLVRTDSVAIGKNSAT